MRTDFLGNSHFTRGFFAIGAIHATKRQKEDRRTLSAYVEKLLEDHIIEQQRRREK